MHRLLRICMVALVATISAQNAGAQSADPPVLLPASGVTVNSFTVNWMPESGADKYYLEVSPSPDFAQTTWAGWANGTNNLTVSSGLQPASLYYYRLSANVSGVTSAPCPAANVTTDPFPAPLVLGTTNITLSTFATSWTPVPEAGNYTMDISTTPDFGNIVADSYYLGNGTATSANISILSGYTSVLQPDLTYYYRIRAHAGNLSSPYSATQVVTMGDFPAPQLSAATNLTPGNFTANWAAVPGATGYYIDISTSPDFGNYVLVDGNISGGNTTSVDTHSYTSSSYPWGGLALQENTTYYYRIRASINYTFLSSAYSAVQSVTTPPFPAPQAGPATGVSSGNFTMSWTAVPGAVGYYADVSTTPDFSGNVNGQYLGNGTSANLSETPNQWYVNSSVIKPDTTYYYRIYAFDAAGATSQISGVENVTTAPLSGPQFTAPTNITPGNFTLNWTTLPNATDYLIDVSSTPDFGNLVVNSMHISGGNVGSANVSSVYYNATTNAWRSGFQPGTTYYSRIRYFDGAVFSANSDPQAVTTAAFPAPTASTGNIGVNSLTVNWSSVPAATSYVIDVSTTADFGNLVIANLTLGNGTATSANIVDSSITPLQPGATYYYRIRALDNALSPYLAASPYSATQTVTLNPFPTPQLNSATNITTTSFTANWNAVASATSYLIDIATSADFHGQFVYRASIGNSTATSGSWSGLEPGVTYYYRIYASGPYNLYTPASAVASVTTAAVPTPQANAATNVTAYGFTANWTTVAGATYYIVDVSTTPDFGNLVVSALPVGNGSTTSGNVTTPGGSSPYGRPPYIQPDTTYYYRVRAGFSNYTSLNSNTGTFTTAVFPAPNLEAATNLSFGQFTANWDTVPGATGYTFDVSTTPDFGNLAINGQYFAGGNTASADLGSPAYYITEPSLRPNTTYYYRVRANGPNIASPNSTTQSITTTAFPAPQPLAATNITYNSFNVNWQADPGAIGYSLDVSTTPDFGNLVASQSAVGGANATSAYVALYFYSQSLLLPGTTYYYRLYAGGESNITSLYSATQTVTTVAFPAPVVDAVTNLTFDAATINWESVVDAANYSIDVSTTPDFGNLVITNQTLADGNATSATLNDVTYQWWTSQTVSPLLPGTTYYYRLRANQPGFASPNSTTQTFTTTGIPAPVVDASANIGAASFTANWEPVAGAIGYAINISTTPDFGNLVVTNHPLGDGNTTQAAVNPLSGLGAVLQPGTTYYYLIYAQGPNSTVSPGSTAQTFTTQAFPAPVVDAPTNIDIDQFTVNWEPVTGAGGYVIDVSTTSDFGNLVINGLYVADGNTTNATLTTSSSTITVGGGGSGGGSIVVNYGGGVITLPPTGFSGFGGGFTLGGSQIILSQPAVTGPGSGSTYAPDVSTPLMIQPDTTYYYRIRAKSIDGAYSANSTTQNVTTADFPAPQANPPTNITYTSFTANWGAVAEATKYLIDISTSPDFGNIVYGNLSLGDANTTSVDIGTIFFGYINYSTPTLKAGTTYYYRFYAQGPNATVSDYSPTQTVTTASFPAPTLEPATNLSSSGFTANWDPVDGATGYTIDLSTTPDFGNLIVGSWGISGGNTTSQAVSTAAYWYYRQTPMLPDTTYYYRVYADGPNYSSAPSAAQSATTLSFPRPTAKSASNPTAEGFTASWSAVADATSYVLTISNASDFSDIVFNAAVGNTTSYTVANLQPGTTYYYKVNAYGVPGYTGYSNAVGATTASTAVVPYTPDYESWVEGLGLSGNSALPSAQPFADGLPNLARYAMNLGPEPAANALPSISIANVSNVNYLTIQYRVRKGMSGIVVTPQYSSDLAHWTTVPPANVSQLSDPDVNTELYEASVVIPSPGSIYLRVQVTPVPDN